MDTKREQKIADELGEYLSIVSAVEDLTELTPEQQEFKEAADVCLEILKRTKLLSGIIIERPEEFKEAWEENDPAYDFMQQYPISTCEIADEVIKKLRQCE